MVDPRILLNDLNPGKDNFEVSWFPEPYYRFMLHREDGSVCETTGTFRSPLCKRVAAGGTFKNQCSQCLRIPKMQSFKKRCLLRAKRKEEKHVATPCTSACTRNDYLTQHELIQKLQHKEERLNDATSKLFFLTSKHLRLKIRIRTLKEKVLEFSKRGAMKVVCKHLVKAEREGLLNDQEVLKDMFSTIASNLHAVKNGKRYRTSVQMFYEVLLNWGGPRLATFVAININGPEIHSIYRWRKQGKVTLESGLHESNFVALKDVFWQLHSRLPQVPVIIAEDETAIVPEITYNQTKDTLEGFCGVKGINHKCLDHFDVHVGMGEDGYNNIVNAFRDLAIGCHARAILINPLHPGYPKVPVLIQPTCNRFDADFVKNQWLQISQFYNEHLRFIGPLIGQASDGDSRRRKLMLQSALAVTGPRFRPIPEHLGFIFSCVLHEMDGATYTLEDVMDQDYIHNHKKLVNHMHHGARILMMGPYMVHSNHILLILETFTFDRHGLTRDDVERRDRQNWRSAQRLVFLQVQECLQELITGNRTTAPNNLLKGTLVFLKVIWMYVEIFCSPVASLRQRIVYAATVTHFLGIWRAFVRQSRDFSLHKNFLSRETFTDVLLSTHFAVILICYMRDNFPNVPCRLDLSGTDIVETYWSANGQWVGNRHNYSFGRLSQNASHMIRLDQIRVDPQAPKFARPHPKGEVIWPSQFGGHAPQADLTAYPAPGEDVEAWMDGIAAARDLARDAGMAPVDDHDTDNNDDSDGDSDHGDDDQSWFYYPFRNASHPFHNVGSTNCDARPDDGSDDDSLEDGTEEPREGHGYHGEDGEDDESEIQHAFENISLDNNRLLNVKLENALIQCCKSKINIVSCELQS